MAGGREREAGFQPRPVTRFPTVNRGLNRLAVSREEQRQDAEMTRYARETSDLFTAAGFSAGPNAGDLARPGNRGGTVPLSLLEKIGGKSPGMRAIQFLGLLRVPEGKKAGKTLKLARFQRAFVKGTFRRHCCRKVV